MSNPNPADIDVELEAIRAATAKMPPTPWSPATFTDHKEVTDARFLAVCQMGEETEGSNDMTDERYAELDAACILVASMPRLLEIATALQRELAEARFAPMGDNHHNAAACPYCNPEYVALKATVAEQAARIGALMAASEGNDKDSEITDLEATVARLTAERDRLAEALRAFVAGPFEDTDKYLVAGITGEQVNEARALLARYDAAVEGAQGEGKLT